MKEYKKHLQSKGCKMLSETLVEGSTGMLYQIVESTDVLTIPEYETGKPQRRERQSFRDYYYKLEIEVI